jgi:hypothetical protein
MEEGVIAALLLAAPAIRELQLIARAAAALVFVKSFLRETIKRQSSYGTI